MSAVIHAFPTPSDQPDVDQLVDELGTALGDEYAPMARSVAPQRQVTIQPAPVSGVVDDLQVVSRATPRGRAWAALLVAAVAVAMVAVGAWLGQDSTLAVPTGDTVVVEQGDTVWGLAREVAPADADVRAVAQQITQLNSLEGAAITPGQVLSLPALE